MTIWDNFDQSFSDEDEEHAHISLMATTSFGVHQNDTTNDNDEVFSNLSHDGLVIMLG